MPIPRMWPVAANPTRPLVEEYGYQTGVVRSFAGMEQRSQLRRHPIGSLEAEYLLDVEQEAQAAAAVLHRGQNDVWAVPLWMYMQPLGGALSPGNIFVFLDSTVGIPFVDPGGYTGYAAFWSSPLLYEAAEIDSVGPSSISLATPGVTKSWAIPGTYVIPTRVGRLAETIDYEWLTRSMLRAVLRFEFEPETIPI